MLFLFFMLLQGFFLNFYMQMASLKMDAAGVIGWIGAEPWLYLAGSAFFFCVLLATAMVLPNMYAGPACCTALLVVLGLADYKKLATTGEPLFPWDLMLLHNAGEMGTITKGMLSPLELIAGGVAVILGVVLVLKLPRVKLRPLKRILLAVSSAAVAAGFMITVEGNTALAQRLDYENLFWNQKANYAQNGFVFAFAGNLKQKLMSEPEGYGRQAITKIAAAYGGQPDHAAAAVPPETPNIVFMMDEAFFDPTRLTACAFSQDPLSFIHSERSKTPSGYLLSPEFGGNTANVEFEALTGLSMYFLNDGSIPYQQRLVKMDSLPSVVSILKARGYRALALHPFDETFYNRNRVYPMLGFETFTSQKDLPNARRMTPGGYISDQAAVDEAVRELKTSDTPVFLHLVTMQNHFPFTKGLNGDNTITVTGVPSEMKDELETYVQDTRLTDAALRDLQQQLLHIKRPTLVVFWGDHLPALSSGIYAASGWDKEPRLKHETQLMMLANYDLGDKPLGTLSPAFIGPTVFGYAGQALPAYYKMLQQVRDELPGLSKSVLIGANGETVTGLNEAQKKLLDDYRMVEYDLLEGKQYARDLMF